MIGNARNWRRWGRPLALAGLAGAIGWVAFVADRPVPLLDWFDLAIHEVGHLLTFAMPELVMFMAGSLAQIAFPLGMAIYFLARRRDLSAGGFCLAWSGTSAWDVSVYVADAPIQALPLVGGGQHDWAFILGHYEAISRAPQIADLIKTSGALLVLVGIALALSPLGAAERARRHPDLRSAAVSGTHQAVGIREAREYPIDFTGDPWAAGTDVDASG